MLVRFKHPNGQYSLNSACFPLALSVPYRGFETRSKRVDNPRGHHSNPATPNELRAKFELLVGGADPGSLYERLLSIREVDDVSVMFEGAA